jgi:hypothetical protein
MEWSSRVGVAWLRPSRSSCNRKASGNTELAQALEHYPPLGTIQDPSKCLPPSWPSKWLRSKRFPQKHSLPAELLSRKLSEPPSHISRVSQYEITCINHYFILLYCPKLSTYFSLTTFKYFNLFTKRGNYVYHLL